MPLPCSPVVGLTSTPIHDFGCITCLLGASKYSVPLMMTRWAGVLTPQARVDVATRIWILPATKRVSAMDLSLSLRPAWWSPMPNCRVCLRLGSCNIHSTCFRLLLPIQSSWSLHQGRMALWHVLHDHAMAGRNRLTLRMWMLGHTPTFPTSNVTKFWRRDHQSHGIRSWPEKTVGALRLGICTLNNH